tara:strand:+ start:772 stop:978 length:207 start_codon:yes stop_codon:yes gene_type:complete
MTNGIVNNMSRLVLTRKKEQTVVIHNEQGILTSVKVTRIDKNQVRLSFEADSSVKIDREEIYDLRDAS